MTPQMLMLIEATGIQRYIFASNQLGQNIGASELVKKATSGWVFEALPGPHNVDGHHISDANIREDGLTAEVIYAGGGKAAVLFVDEGKADQFVRRHTLRLLKEAPGLQLVIKRKPFDPERDVLAECYQELRRELHKRKQDRQYSVPLAGLGVTATCVFTGAPAVAPGKKDEHLISREVKAKLDVEPEGKGRLKELLPRVMEAGYELAYDFNDFGTKGESSYLAVIHADGNNMGRRIDELGKRHARLEANQAYIAALRRFSRSVQSAAEESLRATVDVLLLPGNHKEEKIGGVVPVPERDGQKFLPFRPIVFGGDDVTFVSEGRLGLALAAGYLSELHARELDDGKPACACAGVAVVKSHHPFSRAYELAEALCQSAKGFVRDWENRGESALSALDWHFATTGLVLPLREVRKREYICPSGSLLMRPVALDSPAGDWRSWKTFAQLTNEFRNEDGEWAGRRNKLKALRDALRGGSEATRLFLRGIRGKKLPDIPQRRDMQTQGWHGNECGYFDVVEGLDFYVPLLKGWQPL